MIVQKTWERFRWVKGRRIYGEPHASVHYHDTYTGWFLLGIIPLFVVRARTRR